MKSLFRTCLVCVWLAVAWTLVSAGGAQAFITAITLDPPNPNPGDIIIVRSAGSLNDGCWAVTAHNISRIGNLFRIDIEGTDSWQPGGICDQNLVDYWFVDELGNLPPGHYAVDLYENHVTQRQVPGDYRRIRFTVAGASSCSCACVADYGCDGSSDVTDVIKTIGAAFRGQTVMQSSGCPLSEMDVNCSGAVDVADVILVVDVAFRGADRAAVICNPCNP